MRVWIFCISSIIIMMATLQLVPTIHSIPKIGNTANYLLLCSVSIYVVVYFFSIKYADELNAKFYLQLKQFIQLSVALLSVIALFLHTVKQGQIQSDTEVYQPIRVVATVTAVGLSDSIYNKKSDSSFRQLVVINKARPLSINDFKKSTNNNNNRNQAINDDLINSFDKHTINDLKDRRLLITAKYQLINRDKLKHSNFNLEFERLNELKPTQSVELILEVKPLATKNMADKNTQSFYYRWLKSRHVDGQANVIAVKKTLDISVDDTSVNRDQSVLAIFQYKINLARWELRQFFQHKIIQNWNELDLEKQQSLAVILSLLTGDRALISKNTKDLYQLGGISHLLAISGTHVLFLAIVLSSIINQFFNRLHPKLYNYVPRSQVQWLVMILVAGIYAGFTGFDVPAARTVFMLMAIGIAKNLLVTYSSRQILLIVALLMAIYDPFVLWQAGYWLSFIAVMLLIGFNSQENISHSKKIALDNKYEVTSRTVYYAKQVVMRVFPFIKLQLWMFCALLPISLLFFGKVSLWGGVVNLFAISIYGWIIVPLNLLAGMIYVVYEPLAIVFWQVLDRIVLVVHAFLQNILNSNSDISMVSKVWLHTKVNAGFTLACIMIALPFLLPKNMLSKTFCLSPLVLLLMIIINQNTSSKFNDKGELITNITLLNFEATPNSYGSYDSSMLIDNGIERWLIVSSNKQQPPSLEKDNASQKKSDSQLAVKWLDALSKMGVSSLTGIIIQTPSKRLYEASRKLKVSMPVGYVWLAGNQDITSNDGEVLGCDSGRQWQSEAERYPLSITAITGWQNIDNTAQWDCALTIVATDIRIRPLYATIGLIDGGVKQLVPLVSLVSLVLPSDAIDKTIDTINSAKVDTVVINFNAETPSKQGTVTDNPWYLWQLLCTDEAAYKNALLLSSSVSLPLMNIFTNHVNNKRKKLNNVIIIDKVTEKNQKKLQTTLFNQQE